jgi:hypothetical protein
VALADGTGYQTVTLVQTETEPNNYVLYVVKQPNEKNEETSNISMEISQDDPDPDDPDVSNVYDFNDGEDPTNAKKLDVIVSLTNIESYYYY